MEAEFRATNCALALRAWVPGDGKPEQMTWGPQKDARVQKHLPLQHSLRPVTNVVLVEPPRGLTFPALSLDALNK